jgi:hypothetical protein
LALAKASDELDRDLRADFHDPPGGYLEKVVASFADRARPINSRSCQPGIPECGEAFSERRERKNDVDMMSKCRPCLRATASALGTLGCSIKPKRSATRVKRSEIGVISTRSSSSVRGVVGGHDGEDDVLLVQHLVVLEIVQAARPARNPDRWSENTAVPGTMWGGRFSRLRISASMAPRPGASSERGCGCRAAR